MDKTGRDIMEQRTNGTNRTNGLKSLTKKQYQATELANYNGGTK